MSYPSTLLKKIDTLTVTPPKFGLNKDKTPKTFSQSVIKIEKKPLKIKMTGDLFMLPNRTEHETYGLKYSLGVEFKSSDCELFDAILDKMDLDGWERKDLHDDGKMYLTLKTAKNLTDFSFTSNLPIKPLRLVNDNLVENMDVTVEFVLSGWYMNTVDDNEEEVKKYGLSMKIKSIWFGPETSPSKKRKVEGKVEVRDDNHIMLNLIYL